MDTALKEIPVMKQRFPGEALVRIRKNALHFLQDLASHGDCSRLQTGPLPPLFMLNHPDLFKEVLVTKNDSFIKGRGVQLARILVGKGLVTNEFESHRKQRKLVLPAFHHSRLVYYAEIMASLAAKRANMWRNNRVILLESEMAAMTLDIVAETLFGSKVGGVESDTITKALIDFQESFVKIVNPFTEILMKLPLPETRKIKKSKKLLDESVFRIIDEHRKHPDKYQDLLSMLLAAREDETGEGMSDEQVRDEVLTLFIAGHETTAIALTWFWYLVAQHPDVEKKMYDEIDQVLEGRQAAFQDVPKLTYTRQVFSEVLRLYPPGWILTREAIEDVTIGDYEIPKGATVDFSPYILHRDERFWPDPDKFDPDRFAPERKKERHKFAYLPFSTGVRGCIGEQFAWMEGLLLIATLAQKWKFSIVEKEPVGIKPVLTLHPDRIFPMRVEQR